MNLYEIGILEKSRFKFQNNLMIHFIFKNIKIHKSEKKNENENENELIN